jgi:drug/metabolite transporter (DMT)-like permease
MGSMNQTGSRRRTVGIAIGAVLLVFFLLGPTLLFGESLSAFGLLLLAGSLLGLGLLIRLRADAALHPVGTVLVVVGIVVLAVASLVLAIGVWGRY